MSQYRAPYNDLYNNIETCPEEYLLWFHHVSWDYKMKNGKTLWQNLCAHYNRGVSETERFAAVWQTMRPYVDEERFNHVSRLMDVQVDNAKEWSNVCLGYLSALQQQVIK